MGTALCLPFFPSLNPLLHVSVSLYFRVHLCLSFYMSWCLGVYLCLFVSICPFCCLLDLFLLLINQCVTKVLSIYPPRCLLLIYLAVYCCAYQPVCYKGAIHLSTSLLIYLAVYWCRRYKAPRYQPGVARVKDEWQPLPAQSEAGS